MKLWRKAPTIPRGTRVKSGEEFPADGVYSYDGHVNGDDKGCYVTPDAVMGIIHLKGTTASKLGSCPHDIYWKLEFLE